MLVGAQDEEPFSTRGK